jgi:hypothetical protein
MTGLTGKQVKIFFDDMGKVLVKQGTILSEDIIFVQIRTEKGTEAIPTNKIVRVEVL